MPTKKGTIRGSTIYFFNKEDNTVSVYTEDKIALKDCPEDIVSDFINNECVVNLTIVKNGK